VVVIGTNAPQFSSPATASFDENQSAFSIDSASGALTLSNAADFEAPSDANVDGVFEVMLNVDDGNSASDQLALTLSVEDVSQLTLSVSYPTPNANLGGDVAFTSVTGFIELKFRGSL